jgi:membrane fusion protein (multidrug efflux system)
MPEGLRAKERDRKRLRESLAIMLSMGYPVRILCILLLLAACDEKKPSPPPVKAAVGVQRAVMKGVNQDFEFVGRIKAVDQVDLRARVEGFIDKIRFREGQDVKTGDLLYQIEKVQYQAAVDQAKANLSSAQALVINDQLQYERQVQLSKDQFSPQSRVDQLKAALDSDKAKVLQTQAALTQAEVNLEYTDIRAPVDGRIGRTAYTLGNLVNPASGVLATIVSQDPIYVLFPVSVRPRNHPRRTAWGEWRSRENRHPRPPAQR